MFLVGYARFAACTSDVATQCNDTGVCEAVKCKYYDKLKQKCRDFPGGGFLIIMDHSTKCAHGDSGLHTFSRRDFYYVCHPDGVMIGLCPDNTVFSDTEKRCITQTLNRPNTIKMHDESKNCNIIVPDCSGVGLFPIPSNCSFYFKCQEHNYNFHQYVYQCPQGTFFHPDLQKCSSSNKCYEAQEDILHNFSKDYFPECHIFGQFRTAKDCSLYYRCVPNMDGSFYQIRYECPYKMYYNIEKECCVREQFQCCDYIPHERIIENYKQQHSLDSTTLDPQPTTVISAINTKITSSMPTYYETTQPLYVGDAQSHVRETSSSYPTANTMPYYSDDDMPIIPDIPKNESSEDDYYEVVESTGDYLYSTPPYDTENQSQAPQFDDEVYETSSDGNYKSSTIHSTKNYETTLIYESSSENAKRKPHPGYDEMEWDENAWDIYGRKRTTTASAPTTSYVEQYTDEPFDETTTEHSDHYQRDYGSDSQYNNPKADTYEGSNCEMLACTADRDQYYETSSSVAYSPDELDPATESYDDQTSITEQTYAEETFEDSYQYNTSTTMAAEEAIEINCTADEDGEIMCNGQKMSVDGRLKLLGYVFEFRKWKSLPDVPAHVPKPRFNFQFTLDYPWNYEFRAEATPEVEIECS
uniref:Chitin-binding type-2 domain-containing protein n=1 Tax=Anopheles dirus TaxID=7168 RepID=A0A2Y9D1J5_9DIPT